ncbi:MAG: outer membrane beta-barrel protein [Terriglobales bacterium]
MKQTVRIAILFTFACAAMAAFSNLAQAQKIDIAFGVSTTVAPSASFVDGVESAPSLSGGVFPGFSGDVLFWHNLGVGAEVYWRASQNQNYLGIEGVNYRPVTYNFNAVYSPKLASHVYLELVGGLGALDTHITECNIGVGSDCGGTSPVGSSNHFDVDFGGGLKLYLKGGFFVRPEARYYWVNNDTDYAGNHFGRVGASIGYTFR